MTTLTFTDVNPRRLVSANRRIHHMVRAEVCAYWRTLAYHTAREQLGHLTEPMFDRARIVVTYRFPDKRRRETSNLYSYVAKPIVDGLVDARLIPDDDDAHVIGPDARRDSANGPHRIVVSIEALP